jgi:Na+/melibiose symporter-like transporter
MITFFSENGIGYGNSWSMAGFGIGIIAIFFAFINYYSLKNVELIEREVKLSEGFFKVLGEVIKLKPLKFLLLFIFFFIFGNAMVSANQNYIIIYVAGSDPDALAGTVLMTMLSFLILSPIVTKISEKWDRKLAISICFVISVIGSVVIRIIGIHSLLPLYFLSVVHSFALVGFWCLFYAFCYDIVALDQYKYGKNREGFIVAFPNLILKFANAVGLQAIGIILALIGYDATAEVQSAGAVAGIANISTIYFAILVVIALVLILTYPINKKVYNKLLTAVEQKNNGNLEYHDPDLDKLI